MVHSVSTRTASTLIKFVEDAVQCMEYKARSDAGSGAPALAAADRPSITEAATHWALNPEQFAAFVPMACAILDICLTRLLVRDSPTISSFDPKRSDAAQDPTHNQSAAHASASVSGSVNATEALSEQELQRIKAASQLLRNLIAVTRVANGSSCDSDISSSSTSEFHASASAAAEDERQSMFMLVTGSGGTGKSRVIHCVRDFGRRWHMSNALRVTATTGAAAANIQASTWQSVVKDNFRKRQMDEVSEELRAVWSSIGLLIIDEISMAGAITLTRINQHLRRLKSSSALFGGVHVVVLGDFWQLGAVRQAPVYGSKQRKEPVKPEKVVSKATTKLSKAELNALDTATGQRIWRQLTNGVELVTNMRAAQDLPFAAFLEKLRVNQAITQLQLDTLNSECLITPTRQPPLGMCIHYYCCTVSLPLFLYIALCLCLSHYAFTHFLSSV